VPPHATAGPTKAHVAAWTQCSLGQVFVVLGSSTEAAAVGARPTNEHGGSLRAPCPRPAVDALPMATAKGASTARQACNTPRALRRGRVVGPARAAATKPSVVDWARRSWGYAVHGAGTDSAGRYMNCPSSLNLFSMFTAGVAAFVVVTTSASLPAPSNALSTGFTSLGKGDPKRGWNGMPKPYGNHRCPRKSPNVWGRKVVVGRSCARWARGKKRALATI
jgi:hypothetical protein